jgi:hypothetical protein
MKENRRKLRAQRIIWKTHDKKTLCWFFFCVNDNKNVDLKCLQTLRCILCYNSPILFCNLKTQARKGLIIYNTTNEITTLKKHVNAKYFIIAKKICGGSK